MRRTRPEGGRQQAQRASSCSDVPRHPWSLTVLEVYDLLGPPWSCLHRPVVLSGCFVADPVEA